LGFDEIGAEAEDYNGEEYLCGMCVSLLKVVELWSVRRTCRARRPTLMMLTIVSYCRGKVVGGCGCRGGMYVWL